MITASARLVLVWREREVQPAQFLSRTGTQNRKNRNELFYQKKWRSEKVKKWKLFMLEWEVNDVSPRFTWTQPHPHHSSSQGTLSVRRQFRLAQRSSLWNGCFIDCINIATIRAVMKKSLLSLAAISIISTDVAIASIDQEGLACIAMALAMPQLRKLTGNIFWLADKGWYS